MEKKASIEQPVELSGPSLNPYLCSSTDYLQQIQLPNSKGLIRNLTHPSEIGKRDLQGKRKRGTGGVAKKRKRKREEQPDVFDHLATILRKQRSQIEWGPQQVPDTSQLDPSTQHGDFLLFHSDPHHEESLRSRTKSKRAELSSEPSCSYSTYEGREEYSPVPSVERPPSLLQADLLSGEGGAYVEAETEWLVPSLDQPREHQQQLPVPVAQVPNLDESRGGLGAGISSMLVPHLSSPSSLFSKPTPRLLPPPPRQTFHQLPTVSKPTHSPPTKQSFHQLPEQSTHLRSSPAPRSTQSLSAARSTLHLRSPSPSASRSTFHLRSPPPSAFRSTRHPRPPLSFRPIRPSPSSRAGFSSPPLNIFHLPPSFSLQDLAQNRRSSSPRPHPQEPLDVRNFAILQCYPREE